VTRSASWAFESVLAVVAPVLVNGGAVEAGAVEAVVVELGPVAVTVNVTALVPLRLPPSDV
jgi:hypothetical protein